MRQISCVALARALQALFGVSVPPTPVNNAPTGQNHSLTFEVSPPAVVPNNTPTGQNHTLTFPVTPPVVVPSQDLSVLSYGTPTAGGFVNGVSHTTPVAAAGDFLLVASITQGTSSSTVTPSGWTLVGTLAASGGVVSLFSQVSADAPSGVSLDLDRPTPGGMDVLSWNLGQASGAGAFATTSAPLGSTPITAPSIAMTTGGLLFTMAMSPQAGTFTTPAGITPSEPGSYPANPAHYIRDQNNGSLYRVTVYISRHTGADGPSEQTVYSPGTYSETNLASLGIQP